MKTFTTLAMLCIAIVGISESVEDHEYHKNVGWTGYEITDLNNVSVTVPYEIKQDDYFINAIVLVNKQREELFIRSGIDVARGLGVMVNYISAQLRKQPMFPRMHLSVKVVVLDKMEKMFWPDTINFVRNWLRENDNALPDKIDTLLYLSDDSFSKRDGSWGEGYAAGLNDSMILSIAKFYQNDPFKALRVAMHELGHRMGMADYSCEVVGSPTYMTAAGDADVYSHCSVRELQRFIRRPENAIRFKRGPPKGTTLLNNPEEWLMANTFTADEQCRLTHGKDAKAKIVEDVCSPWELQCVVNGQIKANIHRRTDYSPCGEGKVCYMWNCVDKASLSSIRPIDGGWGAWYPISECSRKCGGGVQKMKRNCDNPAPKFGGYQCQPRDSNTKNNQLCNTHACPAEGGQ